MKNLEEYFEVVLEKPNGEMENVYYRKDKERFYGEYAIVKAYSKDPKFANQIWYGVVDKKFRTVIRFQLCSKMELFDNHLFVQKKLNDKAGMETMHFRLSNDGICYITGFKGGYRKINKDTVLVSSCEEDGMINLYHIPEEKVVSNSFHEIESFQEKDGTLVAMAKRRLGNHKDKEVMCYIDVHGDIVSVVHEPVLNSYMSVTKECFPFFIAELEKNLPKQDSKAVIRKRLQDSVWIKNRF